METQVADLKQVERTPVEVAIKVYYSRNGNLNCTVNKGHYVSGTDGRMVVLDHKIAEFSRMADGFGRLATTDPEIINFLDNRMATVGDVFDAKKYNELTTSPDLRAKMAMDDNQRLITDNNRLLKRLEDMNRELAATKSVLAAKK